MFYGILLSKKKECVVVVVYFLNEFPCQYFGFVVLSVEIIT